ncbi:MAG: DUF1553 domain-containing protein [Candidatus Sumerlaeia bacterium]|nr:DUF1553 domain-containing protein [Candidatus Sumerlaeia bacterium]
MMRSSFAVTVIAALSALTAPSLPADLWDDARATAAEIDRVIGEAQRQAGLQPSPVADDAEFVRRASLDLTGRVPRAEVTERFLASDDPGKRRLLIEWLMQTPAHREGWSTVWTLWLLGRERDEQRVDRLAFREWVRDVVIAQNMPHDDFAREVLTATGRSDQVGATNYLLQFGRTPADAAGSISRNFLGEQIQCAQCHDHKTEPFTQQQFWEFVAFLEQTRARPIRGESGQPEAAELMDMPRGRPTRIPGTDTVVQPTFVDGTVYPRGRRVNLRGALASEITNPANPAFARATVNRLWAHFTGRGFVEPIDDFRPSNPAQFPELLDFLARDFQSHGFDREHLIRSIMLSDTYQRSSSPTAQNASDERLYTHARLRPMTPEQLFWSLATVTGVDPAEAALRGRGPAMGLGGDRGRSLTPEERLERMITQFVFQHSSDDEIIETTAFAGTIPLSLFRMNSPLVAQAIASRRGGLLAEVFERTTDPGQRADALYLAVLSRFPAPEERQIAAEYLAMPGIAGANERTHAEDLLWALLNSSEFLFNH